RVWISRSVRIIEPVLEHDCSVPITLEPEGDVSDDDNVDKTEVTETEEVQVLRSSERATRGKPPDRLAYPADNVHTEKDPESWEQMLNLKEAERSKWIH